MLAKNVIRVLPRHSVVFPGLLKSECHVPPGSTVPLNDCSSGDLPGYCLSSRGHCSCPGPHSGAVQAVLHLSLVLALPVVILAK